MSDTPEVITPEIAPTPAPSFLSYLIDNLLSNPQAKAAIGSLIRWVLHGAGVALAARPVGHLFNGAASNADWIMLVSGAILSVCQLVWSQYQKWCEGRKTTHLQVRLANAHAVMDQVPPMVLMDAQSAVTLQKIATEK